jgi:hypothetical protein
MTPELELFESVGVGVIHPDPHEVTVLRATGID